MVARAAVAASLALAGSALAAAQGVVSGDWVSVSPGSTVCNVASYGAKCNGVTDDTAAVQKALTACASGGTAVIPTGCTALTFDLTVNKATNFVLSVEGTLRFSNDTAKWNQNANFCLSFEGGDSIAITGGGLVDGQGAAWWPDQNGFRPGLVQAQKVTNLLVTGGTTFLNSPNHNLEFYANNMEVVDVSILASPGCGESANGVTCAHNTDGIDVHGSPAWIHRCTISVGDDNVAMHANDTLVEDCTFGIGHGASIGSLGVGTYLQNITVRRCTFNGTVQATRIKSDPGATGFLRDVTYTDLNMTGVGESILLTMFYPKPQPGVTSSLAISNITFSNIYSEDAAQAGQFMCATESPCTGLVVSNVQHTGTAPKKGWQCQAAYGVESAVTPALCLQPGA